MTSLIRALSWPLITPTTSCCTGPIIIKKKNIRPTETPNIIAPSSPTFQQLIAARRLLCRHYYP